MWLRLVLLPLLLLGFSAMHTLGHAESEAHVPASTVTAAPAEGEHTTGEHNAAPWVEQAAGEDLPELDPTEMCPVSSVFPVVTPGAATTVATPWPQPPPRWTATVRAFDPSGVEAENRPSLAALQILRV
ncbi:hypothetical protein GCM10007147_11830 [Nocardiopsis kunsanensis]|uniref:Uncharacterized protein n=1 Tax=Nocardiopsis kunsanensis TaxID=141693 RepID=A0A919CG48_9ACTN|nr:hypothetical protein GCM10007147_11830 [Nocardiopsis kunsanensis]